MTQWLIFAQNVDDAQKKLEQMANNPNLLTYVGAIVGVFVVIYILTKVFGGPTKHKDLQANQKERLADYPPPPKPGARQLQVNGLGGRIRLVVIAPQGKQQASLKPDDIPGLMGDVVRGLEGVIKADKPRMKIWAPQLSVDGFAPTFHRLVELPEGKEKERWMRLAGPAKIGGKTYLIGLAFLADEPTRNHELNLTNTDWTDSLDIA